MPLFESSDAEPEPAVIAGRALRCQVCQHGTFWRRTAQLHSGLATLFQLEWMGPTAACLICSHCGYVHWFLPPE